MLKWLLGLFAFPASAVVLAWNPSPGATGYRIYQGPAHGFYTNSYDCRGDSQFTNHFTSGTFFFSVTAYNQAGESPFSAEVVYTVKTNALIVTQYLESSDTITGTWRTVSTLVATNYISTNTFYRGRLTATITNQ